jgi:hypothetical protein
MEANATGIYAFDVSTSSIQNCSVQADASAPGGSCPYGINLWSFSNSLISCCGVNGVDAQSFTTAGINCGVVSNTTFIGCNSSSLGAGPAWKYSNSGTTATMAGTFMFGCNNPDPGVIFAIKPSAPSFGQTAIFTDSTTTTVGAAITGSGTNRVTGVYGATSGASPVWTVAYP